MKRVLLIAMPFATTVHPSIGISLLKARLHEEGIPCDIKYFNFDFAEMIGRNKYEEMCQSQGDKTLIREWPFAKHYFGDQLPEEQEYIKYLEQIYGKPRIHFDHFLGIKEHVKPFIDNCINSTPWELYDVIGFTTMFEQNLSSIVLAHRIKLYDPNKTIVFGGANCDHEMGVELHHCIPVIDYVCSGEADFTFPELVKRIREQRSAQGIPGIIYRNGKDSKVTAGTASVENLDSLPYPDYDDYFRRTAHETVHLSGFQKNYGVPPGLPMESSRGCWWGQKSQCKFCGLNRGTIGFRSKSDNRILDELDHLTNKYNESDIFMVDNILDMKYFHGFLLELKKRQMPIQLFFETKANLNKEQVQILHDAGVSLIQPGIESLNTHVLKLMAKGVSSLQNIQLLKYCQQFGVYPGWSIITGFPGEREEDYRQMINLIYRIIHLPPPYANASFSLQRFSPYFAEPEKYGITSIRPESAYKFIYPFEDSKLFNLAYFFEFDYKNNVVPPDYDRELTDAVNYWQECYANNEYLHSIKTSPSTLLIEDGRSNARISRIVLESFQKDIYEYCDRIRGFSSVFSYIREKYGNLAVRERDVRDFLDEMVSLNLMVSEDDRYLSIAVHVEKGRTRGRKVF